MAKTTGREAIVAVLEELLEEMPTLSRGITREIRARVHEYDRVPLGDHAEHVREQQERIIRAVIAGRGLDEEDLRRASALGRLRATQGVSVEAVISAYHVGNRELWRLLDERADRGREFLPEVAGMMWESIHVTSTAIAAAHSLVSRARHTQSLTMRHRFIELLERGQDDAELDEIAAGLGVDVRGPFVTACISAGERPEGAAEAVHEELEYLDGVSFAVQQGAVLLVLAQGADEAALETLLLGLDPVPEAGVGLRRWGLDGARASIRDAVEALRLAGDGRPVVRFSDDWWQALVAAQSERLEPLLAEHRQQVLDNPHLVDAVRSFADSGFSVAAAAKRLHLHANSVAYRLERWHELTGWEPRSFVGLAHSLAACTFVQLDAAREAVPENHN